ncbi:MULTISPECIES: helix-turn-helix domain-containing protein [Rhizobium]|nr:MULTISPECIES: helix-turn-helix domain-containing protein [Rhizobium]AGB73521.1 transcriptional regulator FixK [Rhizobium tropici CIAT 899]ENN84777.1 transcriptional regulator FixK [Rhizobium freirei PRF 81]NEV15328.1 helix-turn-helix domain-containing protein [Rhizobium tropici]TGE87983.1 transcriptional regulator [Rhizobium sp. SEMIA 4088]
MQSKFMPAAQPWTSPTKIVGPQIGGAHIAVTYERGQEIYAQGGSADKCYRVSTGAVRVCRILSNGGRQVVSFHVAGEMFGFEAGSQHRYFAEALALTRIVAFEQGLAQQRHLPELLALALEAMERAQEHLLLIGRQSAIERVATFLLDLCERLGGTRQFRLAMSRQDIADYLALTIETVSRAMSELKEQSIISLRHARMVDIRKPDALRSLCGHVAGLS